ncbi:MAG: Sbal_3080 family lipoprotein [Pseudomonadota bacterium]|nr:Sbal_3080 family lipoprotein [Pseudomonadota bacterium]
MKIRTCFVLLSLAAVAGGCAITQTVKPVSATGITEICVKNNPQVIMADFSKELRSQIEKKGIRTTAYDGERPAVCRHHLEYTANWRWDMAMYLVFAEVSVYESGLLVGQATYDAHSGGGRLDKFGATGEKLRGMLDPLFARR